MGSVKVRASDHESYFVYSLIGLFIPIAGFITGAIFLGKDSKLDRKLGEHIIVISAFGCIIAAILYVGWTIHTYNSMSI